MSLVWRIADELNEQGQRYMEEVWEEDPYDEIRALTEEIERLTEENEKLKELKKDYAPRCSICRHTPQSAQEALEKEKKHREAIVLKQKKLGLLN